MRRNIPLGERIIFALDVPSFDEARRWVERLSPEIGFFKVGLELFLAAGFEVVDMIVDHGGKVMLDLKFLDVPNTVASAVRRLNGRGISLATVHAEPSILRAAAEAAEDVSLLGVTVLTSMAEEDLRDLGWTGSVADLVSMRARKAVDAGIPGLVCSGREAARLRAELGPEPILVTPGIRAEQGGDDQKRTMTAGLAVASGADHVVVGRPIRQAPDPPATAKHIQADIAAHLG